MDGEYTGYQWRPRSDPRFGTGDGPGWIHANSREHALHMVALWQAELRQHRVGPWTEFTQTDDGSGLSGGSPAPSSVPRRFQLYRHEDLTGISGTGVIAEGTEYRDGVASLRWYGEHPSEVWWPSVAEILAVHGHQGATVLRWLDDPPIDLWPTEGASQ